MQVLDTRKTTPGLRALEKQAVAAGGGHNHRMGLHDAILVKDNHIALAGGVGEATRRALAGRPPGVPVEVECASLADVEEALEAGADRLLLDNMTPDQLRAAAELTAGRAQLEASGGVTPDRLQELARHRDTIRVPGLSDPFGTGPRPLHDDRDEYDEAAPHDSGQALRRSSRSPTSGPCRTRSARWRPSATP